MTLGTQHNAALNQLEDREACIKGLMNGPYDTARVRNRPADAAKFDPQLQQEFETSMVIYAGIFRTSLETVVEKAKQDFEAGIRLNLETGDVQRIVSYVPHTEACFKLLKQHGWHFEGICPLTRAIANEVWKPFLAWVKEQDLYLWTQSEAWPYGVKEWLMLEVSSDRSMARPQVFDDIF